MNKYKYILAIYAMLSFVSCKTQLDISNTNNPTPSSAASESGVLSLAQGSIYRNGFYDLKYTDGIYGRFWCGAVGFHEMMGDIIGVEAANAYINQIGCPNKVTLDDGTVVLNPSAVNTQYALLRSVNFNGQSGSNPIYYEWAYMYNMIVAANSVLFNLDAATFSSINGADPESKKATVKAWCYWWKGYAYSRIGSIYYAGIIQNSTYTDQSTNGAYVTKEAIITEASANFDKAIAAMGEVTSVPDYEATLQKLIPEFLQLDKGGVLSIDMWKHSINTMKARNILVNTPVATMTTAQWNEILTLTNDGVAEDDFIFTGRTDENGDFLGTTVADHTQSSSSATNTYKLSERWVQDFLPGDLRKTNNVRTLNTGIGQFNSDRGNSFNTRYTLYNGGNGIAGVKVFASTDPGSNEITLASTFEENELMKAEATMYVGGFSAGSITTGMALIDAVRTYQGAGLPPTVAATEAAAKEQLRKERRIGLGFKGFSFYDARRWGIIDPASSRTGCTVISRTGAVNTNATINYGFLDYWDVPDNELAYNPAESGSAPIANPKQ